MGKVRNENYYQIQGWMVNELGLKGNELMIYAIIYGFSQTDGQYFTGSQSYLAEWTNATDRSVRNTLSSLVEKGLLEKIDKTINKVKYCEYKALIPDREEKSSAGGTEKSSVGTEKSSAGGTEKSSVGTEKSSANNYKNNNISNNKEDKINYLKIIDMYNNTCVSFPHLRSLSDARKKTIKARLKTYTINDFQMVFEKAEASNFLKGANDRNWSATFDWMLKDANMAKILDGNYDNRKGGNSGNKVADELNADLERMASWADKRGLKSV